MIRALVLAATLSATLAVCAGCADSSHSYGLQSGDANYDAMKSAVGACKAKGGTLTLKKDGDATELSDYQCVFGKGSANP